jgi:hypothetical protein
LRTREGPAQAPKTLATSEADDKTPLQNGPKNGRNRPKNSRFRIDFAYSPMSLADRLPGTCPLSGDKESDILPNRRMKRAFALFNVTTLSTANPTAEEPSR